MSCKKVVIGSLLLGAIIGMMVSYTNNSLDYRVSYLKRKLNCLSRKLTKVLDGMSEENLKKYKNDLINKFENIKNKIENLTIKDIKDKGSELVNNIVGSIMDLKQQLIDYSR